ncbi:hypothetical protein KPL71_021009 [Citrus sinensis]|uniref:Uncharacterized protein n=1 Tax=Citrus sinensis TaxID=2711 RepID=A0ACB8JCM2_CITSI|nr:hypothetical protein KPL71_021009 [Citrus sinensis]
MSSIQMHGYDGCLEEERIGLLEIKRFFISMNGGEYADEILTSWVDDAISDCCDWERLKCNVTTGRVMELSLNYLKHYKSSNSNSSSDGAIILDLSLFPPFQELQSLDLSENCFGGVHESKAYNSSGNLKQLKILNLGNNRLNDSILSYLNTLTSLTTLILCDNSIEGSRTKQGLANLRYLQVLDLSGNPITGRFIARLGLSSLRNLKRLDLSNNYGFTTPSQELANLTNLEFLDLSGNSLTASITRLAVYAPEAYYPTTGLPFVRIRLAAFNSDRFCPTFGLPVFHIRDNRGTIRCKLRQVKIPEKSKQSSGVRDGKIRDQIRV